MVNLLINVANNPEASPRCPSPALNIIKSDREANNEPAWFPLILQPKNLQKIFNHFHFI
jgi:hypothetical protein